MLHELTLRCKIDFDWYESNFISNFERSFFFFFFFFDPIIYGY